MSELNDSSLVPTPLGSRPTSRDETGELPADQVRLALPVLLPRHSDRRVVSAPTYGHSHRQPVALPSINETGGPSDKSRIVSAPPHTPKKANGKGPNMDYLSRVENSIRIVNSPSAPSPVKAPEPLNVRKKINTDGTGRSFPQRSSSATEGFEKVVQGSSIHDAQGAMKKKKSSWFKRSSKVESEGGGETAEWQDCSSMIASSDAKRTDSSSIGVAAKKKSFTFPFWKNNKARDSGMSISRKSLISNHTMNNSHLTEIGGPDDKDIPSSEIQAMKAASNGRTSQMKWHESGSGGVRNIEVKQNWLARLFRVKPATSHMCMAISRRRARQEVAILLREWRKYGIRGIQVDKQRNIVFARVGAKNCK